MKIPADCTNCGHTWEINVDKLSPKYEDYLFLPCSECKLRYGMIKAMDYKKAEEGKL